MFRCSGLRHTLLTFQRVYRMSGYEIVFDGRLVEGAQLERVKANLGKLFQADESRLELLFSGRRLVLKNNLDEQTAEKYRAALELSLIHI